MKCVKLCHMKGKGGGEGEGRSKCARVLQHALFVFINNHDRASTAGSLTPSDNKLHELRSLEMGWAKTHWARWSIEGSDGN